MDSTVVLNQALVNVLVGIAGLAAICTVVVQAFKEVVPSKQDADGNEVGMRRWLPIGLPILGAVLGAAVAFLRGDHRLEEFAAMWVAAWSIAGFLTGAASVGLYGGLKALLPSAFSGRGWFGGGE